jgi:DNA-binding cell septation regulator SpoVG
MSLPLRIQLFDAYLGQQSGIHSIILPDIFSSGGSKNVWMDKYARVKRILGYSAQGAAVTSSAGQATRVRNYFPYRKTATSIVRQLIGVFDDGTDEWEIQFSTDDGATWTLPAGGDMGAGSVGQIADFAQFGTNLYITNGKIAPRVWDSATLSTAGDTQQAAPTVASAGTGVLYGTPRWKIVPRKSDGTRLAGSVSSLALSVEGESALVTWVASPNVLVVGYEVYRTTGTGGVFYYVDYVDGIATVAYTDNIEDYTILEQRTLEEHGDAPPQSYLCVAHSQRMWWMRTDENPQRGYYSDPGTPQSVWTDNFIEFQDAETQGDFITGARGNYESMLVVFQERSIWTLSGTGQIIGNVPDFSRTRTNAQTGAVSDRAIVKVPAGSRYVDQTGKVQTTATVTLAYLTPLRDIRLFDGDNDLTISYPVSAQLEDFSYEQRRKTHTLHDTLRSEITWFYAAGSASEPSAAVVWNYQFGVWYVREWAMSAAAELETSTVASLCVGGEGSLAIGGLTYQLWDTNLFNGAAFTAIWMTKTLYGMNEGGQPAMSFQKRWRWSDFLFETDQNVEILVEWLNGDAPDNGDAVGSVTITPGTDVLETIDAEVIETSDGDEIHVALSSSIAKAQFADMNGQYLHDNGIRLRFSSVAEGSWSLEGNAMAYQILPGLKRRRGALLNP